MNQSEMKRRYPPGTRILLLQMGDDPRPIEANTKGTVRVIDDIGTLHGDFDNGRQLGIVPGCWRQTKCRVLRSSSDFKKVTTEKSRVCRHSSPVSKENT